MKPVVIFRHSPGEGPGYFASYLERKRIAWKMVKVDAGEAVPASAGEYSGLAFMGGPMSVNDDLPWIPATLRLIRAAVEAGVPVLGHCLGAQLMSKALGGTVGPNPVKEIGWGRVDVADSALARAWFGDTRSFLSFHWHGETYSLPPGAECIASSPYCANQAFVLERHLGMQCHVEMTPEMVSAWCESGKEELARCACPAVQDAREIQAHLQPRVVALNAVAARLYDRWIDGLKDRPRS
ncbi:MAG: type 1 glutamine amidotransferase [Burkholderiales bacterium]|nr:type 1 glutamine amidotransferase [Burkholderiales bacterium]